MRKFIAILLCGALAFTGVNCATTDDQSVIAEIVMNQLDATLDSVAVAITQFKGEEDAEVIKDIKFAIALVKPQILSWINTIKLINEASGQYSRADKLIERFEGMEADINYIVPDVVL